MMDWIRVASLAFDDVRKTWEKERVGEPAGTGI